MASNKNGFAEQAKQFGTLAKVPKKVTMESLEESAEFFVEKMLPKIPKSLMKKKHMRDHVKVVVEDEQVKVVFEDTAFYWRFSENGTRNQKAQNFASGTWESNKTQIENIMTRKIIEEMEM